MAYIIPAIFIFIVLFAAYSGVNVFTSFSNGVREAIKFTLDLLPILASVFVMCELFERSYLSQAIINFLTPAFKFLGVPQQLTKLILIKPFSGSGSLAYLTEVLKNFGADSYIGRCACVLYSSSETVFYISAVYFCKSKQKRRFVPIAIVIFATALSTIFGCLICRIL